MRRLTLLSVAFLVVISGCATTSRQPEHSVDQLKDLGEKCLAAGETANALKYLTEAEEKKPDDATVQYALALAYDQRGLQDKALQHLQNALKIKPNYPEALNTIGYIYATRGQFELARAAFQKALDDPFYRTPQFAAYNLGRLYEKKGEPEKALSYYQQAVKFDQNYGMAWLRMGQILEQLSRTEEARHAYGNAVRASSNLAEAQLRFGILSYLAGDLEPALHALSMVGQIAPNTDMADEARKYLDKINASATAQTRKARSHASSPVLSGEIEVNPSEGIQHQQMKEEVPTGALPHATVRILPIPSPAPDTTVKSPPASTQQGIPEETHAPAAEKAPVPNKESAPAQGGVTEGHESQPDKYTVQVGSFEDRQKADEIKARLVAKGYQAVVRTVKHGKLGTIFVIQLQPVNSVSKASTLMTQLSGEVEGDLKIIVVPSR
jgi:tetratricopeptide (TPR) repeat protein